MLIHSTSDLVTDLLPTLVAVDLSIPLDIWKEKSKQTELPPTAFRGAQRIWDTPLCNVSLSALMSVFQDSEVHTARLLGASRPESGLWLNALPSAHIGNLLNDDTLRIAVGLRIGAELCKPHECFKCRKEVTSYGHHGLSCRFAAGTHARHGGLNNIVCRALVSANIPSKLEPRGTSHTTGQRPDGYTTFAWKQGLCLAWDVTCVDTVCQSHVKSTATAPASAAEQAEKKKRRLYSYLEGRYMFEPLGFETFGAWGSAAISLIKEIAKRLKENTGEPRSHEYLRQRLSLEIQRGNAASVLGTVDGGERLVELYLL